MGVLDSLLVELGFEYQSEDLDDFKKGIGETIGLATKLVASLIAGSAAVTAFATVVSAATDEQGKLANEIGLSVEVIDALSHSLVIAGGSSNGMATSLQQLSIRASEAARGMGTGVEAFGILGISVTKANGTLKDADALLFEVSNKMQGMDKAQQIELADKLGLRDSIRLLQQGSMEMQRLRDEALALGTITKEDAALAADFQDSLANLTHIGKIFSNFITRSLLPSLQKFNDKMIEWWKNNKDLIQQNIPIWIAKISAALKLLTIVAGIFIAGKLVMTIFTLVKGFKLLSIMMLAVKSAAMLMNAAVFLLPVLVGLLAAAFVGLAEDAKVFFEGGDSMFGSWIKKFPEWKDELQTAAAVFATMAELTTRIFDGWSQIFDLFKTDIDFSQFGNFLLDTVGAGPQSAKEDKDAGREQSGEIMGFLDGLFSTQSLAPQVSMPSITNANRSASSSTIINKVEIVIDGSKSPKDTANGILEMLKQAGQDLNTAVFQ